MNPNSEVPYCGSVIDSPMLYTMRDNRMDGAALLGGPHRVAEELTRSDETYRFDPSDPIRGVYAPDRNEVLVLGRRNSDLYLAVKALLKYRGATPRLMCFESVVLGGEFVTRAPVVREAVTAGVRDATAFAGDVDVWRDGSDVVDPKHLYRIVWVCRLLGIPAGSRARFEWTDDPDYSPEMEALLDREGFSLAPKRFDGDLEVLYRELPAVPSALIDRTGYRREGRDRGWW